LISSVRHFLIRFKWFILGGCSLITLIVISGLLLVDTQPGTESIDLSPVPANPTNTPEDKRTATPTVIVRATSTPEQTSIVEQSPGKEIAYVERVIDGDSIEIVLNGELLGLRYIGIDTPEIGMPYSLESTELNQNMVEGQIVELERDVSDTDQYGRLLRYVYLQDGTMVNAELVRLGYALAVAYPPDTKYQEIINSSELEAKENELGLWAPPSPTAPVDDQDLTPRIQVEPSCSQFNSPGNDNENKNEEYVCIANAGSGAVDLTGWTVKDQYGWTYQFPTFSLNEGFTVKIRTGCGTDSQQDLYWCKDETAVWNNDGDCVFLIDQAGELRAEYCY
jgi:endonuclease YncB( thermonuclease family)